jgi:ferredoxin/flavodoxin
MKTLNVALVYFSATDMTRTYARIVRDEISTCGGTADLIDVTSFASRQKPLSFDNYDGVLFGFPVFADFPPAVFDDWLPALEGKGKPAAMYFTYGGRTPGYSHYHTLKLLAQARFRVLFSAEFLARHSFNIFGWNAAAERPNEDDIALARTYARLALEKFSLESPEPLILQRPFAYRLALEDHKRMKTDTEPRWAQPYRAAETCSMCRLCETECANQSFNADTGLADPQTCIECLHCLHICPDKVLVVGEDVSNSYHEFLDHFCLTETMINTKKSKLITEFWHTAV